MRDDTGLHRVIAAGARLVHLAPGPVWAGSGGSHSPADPVFDPFIALTLHNLFGRHPKVRIVSIENGSDWLKPLFKTVDKAAELGRREPMIGGRLPASPSETLAEHLWVCPFPGDDVGQLTGALGADHMLFGSDWPHPEGIRQPADYLAALAGQNALVTREVLRANTRPPPGHRGRGGCQ